MKNLWIANVETLLTRLDPVLHAVQLPAGVAHLDSGLADVDRDAFPHDDISWRK